MSRDADVVQCTCSLQYPPSSNIQVLSILSGFVATNLDALIMKELVGNSLDAAKGAKSRIAVSFETSDNFLTLTVRDRREVFGPVECGALDGVLASTKRYGVVYEPKPRFLGVSR